MVWLIPALVAPFFFALANMADATLTNRRITSMWALLFFVSVLNILYVPAIFPFDTPHWPTANQWPVFLLIGFTNAAYLFPYYRALQSDDTSVVSALFSLGKLFIPLLAFFFVGERLSLPQYIGLGIVLFASAALTFRPKTRLRWNPSFAYMALASFIIAIEVVATKYALADASWGTVFAWQAFFSWLFVIPLLAIPASRKSIVAAWPAVRRSLLLLVFMEACTFAAFAFSTYAISLGPVSLVSAVIETSPIFVLLLAVVCKPFFPSLFKEETTSSALTTKLIWFAAMILGLILLGPS